MSATRRPKARALGLSLAAYLAFLVATVAATVPFLQHARAATLTSPALGVAGGLGYIVLILVTIRFARDPSLGREVLAVRATPLRRAAKAVVAAIGAGAVGVLVLEPIFHGGSAQRITAGVAPQSTGSYVLAGLSIAVICVVGPVAEELYFRGLLFGALLPLGQTPAVLLSAGLFAVVHFTPAAMPVIAVLGVLFGLLRVHTDSIWPGIVLHVLNNTLAVLVTIS